METVFRWDNVETRFDEVIAQLEPILPRHIARWKNMKIANWQKNIKATKYYARVRPKKIPALLKTAMKLTDAEVEEYFGHAMAVLEEYNTFGKDSSVNVRKRRMYEPEIQMPGAGS